MKKGRLFGVGVGPGDKELITVKAVNTLKNADAVAVPKMKNGNTTAYDIARDYIRDKDIIYCTIPMTKDSGRLKKSYIDICDMLEKRLSAGEDIAFITLGDPSVYSSYMQINYIMTERGYETDIIPGVTSFCAAAARLKMPLCEKNEPLVVIPAGYERISEAIHMDGCKVIMKPGKNTDSVFSLLDENDLLDKTYTVECCGMENEKIYTGIDGTDRGESYFSVIIVKEH